MLYQGALVFALMDVVFIPLLVWRMKKETFRRLKWPLVIAAALTWYGIWSWSIDNFWEDVYSFLFPAWAQSWFPRIAFIAAGLVTLGLWTLSLRIKGKPVLIYCLLGGISGSITHIWAVYRGTVTKVPCCKVPPHSARLSSLFLNTSFIVVSFLLSQLSWIGYERS